MAAKAIKNIVFDIGNVFVRWNPEEIMRLTFGDNAAIHELIQRLFRNSLWRDLNLGNVTEQEVKAKYQQQYHLSPQQADMLLYYVRESLIEIYGTVALLKKVKAAGYHVYALTDNVIEIVEYLKQRYDFWPLFEGVIVSAEEHCLKPDAEIFQRLLDRYQLNASESVFIDDVAANVKGAQAVGFYGIQFTHIIQCENDLQALGIEY